MNETTSFHQFEKMHEEQLPVPKHKLHDWTHFAGLYAAIRCKDNGHNPWLTHRKYLGSFKLDFDNNSNCC